MHMNRLLTGLENIVTTPPEWLYGLRIGLLCNPASVDSRFRHARHLINKTFPGQLTALFSPQHGLFAEKQDNMIESDHFIDSELNIPVFSLYGKTRIPTDDMMDAIDVLMVDIQDVGTRVYTFVYTVSYCMEAAARHGKKLLILDRPNPVGGMQVEGNLLLPEYASFVGRYPIPMRHGLTIGEFAAFINSHYRIGCDLEIFPMTGWRRHMYFSDTGLPWIAPSPNLPTPASAMVYPGQVLLEGTNISEGRGTTQPFELFGAPFINVRDILSAVDATGLSGARLRPVLFEPTSGKWAGMPCHGFQIHVTDPSRFSPYATTIRLLAAIYKNHRELFAWKTPPYEYEYEKKPIDLITGDPQIRLQIEAGEDVRAMRSRWKSAETGFMEITRPYHLYE